MALKLIAGILLGIWLVLVLLGKGGFIHVMLLSGVGIAIVALMIDVRARLKS